VSIRKRALDPERFTLEISHSRRGGTPATTTRSGEFHRYKRRRTNLLLSARLQLNALAQEVGGNAERLLRRHKEAFVNPGIGVHTIAAKLGGVNVTIRITTT
jgi:hypothetical protein